MTVPVGVPPLDVTVAVKVTDWPNVLGLGGEAASAAVVVARLTVTMMAGQGLEPPGPVKVPVYVVVCVGVTVIDPDGATEPMPGEIMPPVALADDQDSVEL